MPAPLPPLKAWLPERVQPVSVRLPPLTSMPTAAPAEQSVMVQPVTVPAAPAREIPPPTPPEAGTSLPLKTQPVRDSDPPEPTAIAPPRVLEKLPESVQP